VGKFVRAIDNSAQQEEPQVTIHQKTETIVTRKSVS